MTTLVWHVTALPWSCLCAESPCTLKRQCTHELGTWTMTSIHNQVHVHSKAFQTWIKTVALSILRESSTVNFNHHFSSNPIVQSLAASACMQRSPCMPACAQCMHSTQTEHHAARIPRLLTCMHDRRMALLWQLGPWPLRRAVPSVRLVGGHMHRPNLHRDILACTWENETAHMHAPHGHGLRIVADSEGNWVTCEYGEASLTVSISSESRNSSNCTWIRPCSCRFASFFYPGHTHVGLSYICTETDACTQVLRHASFRITPVACTAVRILS